MTEMVADFLKRKSFVEQMSSACMAQRMWAVMGTFDFKCQHPLQKPAVDVASWPEGSPKRKEDLPPATLWAHLSEVSNHRMADGRGQRVRTRPAPFGSSDYDAVVRPIYILKAKSRDLADAKTIYCQQHRNGPLSDVCGTIRVHIVQKSLHVFPRRPGRQRFLGINARALNGVSNVRRTPSLSACESEEGSERICPNDDGSSAPSCFTRLLQEPVNVGNPDIPQPLPSCLIPSEEVPEMPDPKLDRRGREAALIPHPGGKSLDFGLMGQMFLVFFQPTKESQPTCRERYEILSPAIAATILEPSEPSGHALNLLGRDSQSMSKSKKSDDSYQPVIQLAQGCLCIAAFRQVLEKSGALISEGSTPMAEHCRWVFEDILEHGWPPYAVGFPLLYQPKYVASRTEIYCASNRISYERNIYPSVTLEYFSGSTIAPGHIVLLEKIAGLEAVRVPLGGSDRRIKWGVPRFLDSELRERWPEGA